MATVFLSDSLRINYRFHWCLLAICVHNVDRARGSSFHAEFEPDFQVNSEEQTPLGHGDHTHTSGALKTKTIALNFGFSYNYAKTDITDIEHWPYYKEHNIYINVVLCILRRILGRK